MTVTVDNEFRLSRIEAEGWKMAHEYMPDQTKKPDQWQVADLNPYRADAARRRWSQGFNKAVETMHAR